MFQPHPDNKQNNLCWGFFFFFSRILAGPYSFHKSGCGFVRKTQTGWGGVVERRLCLGLHASTQIFRGGTWMSVTETRVQVKHSRSESDWMHQSWVTTREATDGEKRAQRQINSDFLFVCFVINLASFFFCLGVWCHQRCFEMIVQKHSNSNLTYAMNSLVHLSFIS